MERLSLKTHERGLSHAVCRGNSGADPSLFEELISKIDEALERNPEMKERFNKEIDNFQWY